MQLGKRGEGYVAVQCALFALIAFGPGHLPGLPLWSERTVTLSRPLGVLLATIGGALIILGLAYLGKNLSPLPHPKAGAQLVERGVYGLVRHPIYGGLITGTLGWALLRGSTLTLIYTFILFGFFELKTRREEAQLGRAFADYEAYRKRVRKFIPFIY